MKNYKNITITFLLFVFSAPVFSQGKFWVTFTDKDTDNYKYQEHLSPKAIANRKLLNIPLYQTSDVPVNKVYVDSLKSLGFTVINRSKWLNSVTIQAPADTANLKKLSFVKEISPVNANLKIASNNIELDTKQFLLCINQMKADVFLNQGITGDGVTVGIIDAGFYNAHVDPFLKHLFDEGKILGQRDFISPDRTDIITTAATGADTHGQRVLQNVAGYYQDLGMQMGLGVNAQFYLARTENGEKEHRGEEDDWIRALEWMDSLGVRLVNTSLGYAINMDDPADNYLPTQMDGKTARITKAAQIASDEKGMLLVISAGNEGDNAKWRIISAPADAEGVISVGATKGTSSEKIGYSSIGPEYLSYMKPNVSCFSAQGTSFSAPAIAGFAACIMQMDSTLTNKEIKDIIEKSSSIYPYGNNYIGYGIPQADRAMALVASQDADFGAKQVKVTGKKYVIKDEDAVDSQKAVLFHKKNDKVVSEQEEKDFRRGKIKVVRKPGISRTTVSFRDKVVEVIWE